MAGQVELVGLKVARGSQPHSIVANLYSRKTFELALDLNVEYQDLANMRCRIRWYNFFKGIHTVIGRFTRDLDFFLCLDGGSSRNS